MGKEIARPFLKWAGGKGQILHKLNAQYPDELFEGKIKIYIEPFVGGGAVLFDILQNFSVERAVIIDLNKELINCYRCIKENVYEIIKQLEILQSKFYSLSADAQSLLYSEIREKYNIINLNEKYDYEKAADFIFLNKTCFNGLYRVNSKGEFNVPFGKYTNPLICDRENLILINKLLQRVEILHGDYKQCIRYIDKETFIYLDPPYRPITETQSFVGYSQGGFNDGNQKELAEFAKKLDKMGCKVLLSNSDPKNTNPTDDFFDDLYRDFTIMRISAKRMINCQAEKRGDITEILVRNYDKGEKMRDFKNWLKQFKTSISDFGYYIDFKKVYKNIDMIKIELNILNSLINSKNIEQDFRTLVRKYPQVIKCVPLLLAVRGQDIYVTHNNQSYVFDFKRCNDIDNCVLFMRESGLFDLISNHIISDLVDYATGVEVGLDSNGRKNRGGHLMENVVEEHIKAAGIKNYRKEMYLEEIEKEWNIDLSAISNKGKARKRFDFVIKTDSMIYAIETNFYSGYGGGSKLNETARSYKLIAQESKNIKGFKFIWITDGTAWNSAKGNLEETFDTLDDLYNLTELENGVFSKVIK